MNIMISWHLGQHNEAEVQRRCRSSTVTWSCLGLTGYSTISVMRTAGNVAQGCKLWMQSSPSPLESVMFGFVCSHVRCFRNFGVWVRRLRATQPQGHHSHRAEPLQGAPALTVRPADCSSRLGAVTKKNMKTLPVISH